MYEDMMCFFNSEQWRVIQLQELLKRWEKVVDKEEANEAVLSIYKTAVSLVKNTPNITVDQAVELIDFNEKEK